MPETKLDREHDAPTTPPVYVGLEFRYNGRKYEVEQILAGARAICHSAYGTAPTTILSFASITKGK